MSKKKRICEYDWKDLFWGIPFLMAIALIFWRCRYGIPDVDESFYITVPYRLLQGDGLFVQEWHLSQMAGILLLPFVWLYRLIFGGMDGIFLAMRYLCCTVMGITGIFLYTRLKPFNQAGAAIASVAFTLYIPFGIPALSYNSLGIITLTVAMVLLLTAKGKRKLPFFIAGVFFAAAVLCNPYLLLLYIGYAIFLLVRRRHTFKETSCRVDTIRGFFYLTGGAAVVAFVFFGFVFLRVSISEFFKALPLCLHDPEHPPLHLFEKIIDYFGSIGELHWVCAAVHIGLILLWIICLLDKKRKEHKKTYFMISIISIFILLINFYYCFFYLNFLMWPINLIAPFALLLCDSPKAKNIFWLLWFPGMFYSFCMHLSSNQFFYAIFSGSAVATVGSAILLGMIAKECFTEERVEVLAILIGFVMVWFISLMDVRYTNVFWDSPVEYQTEHIDQGIYRGINCSQDKMENYKEHLKEWEIVNSYHPDKVLFLSKATWLYLLGDYESSAYSAWLSGVNVSTIERLENYYELNPDKMPDVVYVEKENRRYAMKFCQAFDYHTDYNKECIILTKQ